MTVMTCMVAVRQRAILRAPKLLHVQRGRLGTVHDEVIVWGRRYRAEPRITRAIPAVPGAPCQVAMALRT